MRLEDVVQCYDKAKEHCRSLIDCEDKGNYLYCSCNNLGCSDTENKEIPEKKVWHVRCSFSKGGVACVP